MRRTAGLLKYRAIVATAFIPFFLVGCAYQPYTIEEIDESGPQKPAAITLSDPQIYSRETLINDRRAEREYLEALLSPEAMKSLEFGPDLVRELNSIQAVSAGLGVTYNPIQGATGRNDRDLAELQHQIERTRLETELAAELKRLQATRAADAPVVTIDASSPDGDGDGTSVSGVDNSAAQARVKEIFDRLDKLSEGPGAASRAQLADKAKVSPRDQFYDRQAYRNELRSALAEVNLDDLHDHGGSALYRLQFNASVFPGKKKDKWGAMELVTKPPRVSADEIEELYEAWLRYIAGRLNYLDGNGKPRVDAAFESLLDEIEFLRVIRVPVSNVSQLVESKDSDTRDTPLEQLYLRVPIVSNKEEPATDLTDLFTVVTQCKLSKDSMALRPYEFLGLDQRLRQAAPERGKTAEDELGKLVVNLDNCRSGSSIDVNVGLRLVKGLQNVGFVLQTEGGANYDEMAILIEETISLLNDAIDLQKSTLASENKDNATEEQADGNQPEIPIGFLTRLLTNVSVGQYEKCASDKKEDNCSPDYEPSYDVRGQIRVYDVAPKALSQRFSTVASATSSFSGALALSANIAQAGAAGDLDLGMLQKAMGSAEALERIPLVVGYIDSRGNATDDNPGVGFDANYAARVGWIFGPEARIDGKKRKIKLVHAPETYRVTTDIVVPGWWPRMSVRTRSAWIQDWDAQVDNLFPPIRATKPTGESGDNLLGDISFPLPVTNEDLDGLTDMIAGHSFSRTSNTASIKSLTPQALSACGDEVSILVRGANLWRGAKMHLAGVEGRKLRILPDMNGVSASFKIADLFKADNSLGRNGTVSDAKLTVLTSNGRAERIIKIFGTRKAGNDGVACEGPASLPTVATNGWSNGPIIKSLSPPVLSACATDASLVLSGENLGDTAVDASGKPDRKAQSSPRAFVGGKATETTAYDNQIATVDLKKIKFAEFGKAETVPVTYLNPGSPGKSRKGTATALLRIAACTPAKPAPAKLEVAAFVNANRLIKGVPKSVTMSLALPSGLIEPTIGIRPVGASASVHIERANGVKYNPDTGALAGKINMPDNLFGQLWKGFKDEKNQVLDTFLIGKMGEKKTEAVFKVKGHKIYAYKDAAAEKIKLTADGSGKPELKLAFPHHAKEAFAGLRQKSAEYELKKAEAVKDQPLVPAAIGTPGETTADIAKKLRLVAKAVKIENSTQTLTLCHADRNVSLDAEFSVELKIKSSVDLLPAFQSNKVTLKVTSLKKCAA